MAKPISGNRKLIEAGQKWRKLLREVDRKNIQLSVDARIAVESVRHASAMAVLEYEKAHTEQ